MNASAARPLVLLIAFGAALCGRAGNSATPAQPLPFGETLDGKPLPRLAPPGTRAVVLFFAATDCPISNRYLPDIAELNTTFTPQGVEILSVYPNPGDTRDLVAAHQHQFAAAENAVLDRQQALVHLAHARMTPEAAVFIPAGSGWREVYLGRIDDRYLSLGKERPAATHHDLAEAIRAVLGGKPVPAPGGPAVGCGIMPLPA